MGWQALWDYYARIAASGVDSRKMGSAEVIDAPQRQLTRRLLRRQLSVNFLLMVAVLPDYVGTLLVAGWGILLLWPRHAWTLLFSLGRMISCVRLRRRLAQAESLATLPASLRRMRVWSIVQMIALVTPTLVVIAAAATERPYASFVAFVGVLVLFVLSPVVAFSLWIVALNNRASRSLSSTATMTTADCLVGNRIDRRYAAVALILTVVSVAVVVSDAVSNGYGENAQQAPGIPTTFATYPAAVAVPQVSW